MRNKWLWQSKPWEAFKTFAILFSFATNVILLLVLLLAAPLIIPIVNDVAVPLVGGLSDSFVEMEQARIERTIDVNDNIPIAFVLPLDTNTSVTLTEGVPLRLGAQFILPDGGGMINGVVLLELPQDLSLPIALSLDVPVSQTVPVNLAVAVDIPMQETELGGPFAVLKGLFAPLDQFLRALPASNEELFDRIRGEVDDNTAVPMDAGSN